MFTEFGNMIAIFSFWRIVYMKVLTFCLIRMIGAMPAVAVRHERRRQEKRLKRPSQLYLGGQWLPPLQGSPPTPSPHGHNNLEPLPELYLCGKVTINCNNISIDVKLMFEELYLTFNNYGFLTYKEYKLRNIYEVE